MGKASQAKAGTSSATTAPPRKRARRWAFRIAAVLLSAAVFWGIPELIVRLIDPPLLQFKTISFGGDPNSPLLFMKDPDLFWRLRPETDLEFSGVRVRTNENGFRDPPRSPGEHTVLCVGDSTTFGWRVDEEAAFPSQLERLLNSNRVIEPRKWQTINAGVPGYTAFQTRRWLEDLLPQWRPAYLVINLGNNASWPEQRSDAQLAEDRKWRAALQRFLWKSKFLTWAAERISPDPDEPSVVDISVRVSPRLSCREYVENVAGMIRLAREHGTQVILVEPTVNLLTAPEPILRQEKHEAAVQQASDALVSRDPRRASDIAERILARDPERFDMLWVRGMVMLLRGRRQAAVAALEAALEKNPFPERAKLSYRSALAELAAREAVPCIEINEKLRAHAEELEQPHSVLFVDHCHPTERGHAMIAYTLVHTILAEELKETLRLKPDDAETHNKLGLVLQRRDKPDEAVRHFQEAVRIRPDYVQAHNCLALALVRQDRLPEAVKHFEEALRIRPDYAEARHNLGLVRQRQGNLDEAAKHFREALRIRPNYAQAHCGLALALAARGGHDEAVHHFHMALEIRHDLLKARYGLASTLVSLGKVDRAIGHCRVALRLKGNSPEACNRLAWLLATRASPSKDELAEAVQLAEQACRVPGYDRPEYLDTLAAAYAAAGRFDEAISTAEKAIDLARGSGREELAAEIQARLELYQAGKPYRLPPPSKPPDP